MCNKLSLIFFCFFLIGGTLSGENYKKALQHMDELQSRSYYKAVENKLYWKQGHLEIYPGGGSITNDPLVNTNFLGSGFAYHFSDLIGIEAAFYFAFSDLSEEGKKYKEQFPIKSLAPKNEHFYNINVLLSPIYAKMSFLSNAIIHHDIYLTAGIGNTQTTWAANLTYNFGFGVRVFMFSRYAVNISLRDYIHQEKRESIDMNIHNVLFIASISYFAL